MGAPDGKLQPSHSVYNDVCGALWLDMSDQAFANCLLGNKYVYRAEETATQAKNKSYSYICSYTDANLVTKGYKKVWQDFAKCYVELLDKNGSNSGVFVHSTAAGETVIFPNGEATIEVWEKITPSIGD